MSAQPPSDIHPQGRGWWHSIWAPHNLGEALHRAGLYLDEAAAVFNVSAEDVLRLRQPEMDWETTEIAFALAERLRSLSAHDKMRLAAFRAEQEVAP